MTKAKRVRYHHITKEERFKIESYLEDDIGVREIARRLSRSPSTISEEITRGSGKRRRKTYTARTVHRTYLKRLVNGGKKMNVVLVCFCLKDSDVWVVF